MNVTPLVDVVLVLLIIFMVITPMMAKQFWIALPDKKEELEPAPPPDAKDSVMVTVAKDGKIRINRDVVPDAEFRARLTRVLAASGQRTIFFDAHDAAPFGRASQALDMPRGGGAATIAVATGPTNTAIIDKRAAFMSCRTTPKNSPVATVRTSRSSPFVHHNKGKYQARDLRIAGALRCRQPARQHRRPRVARGTARVFRRAGGWRESRNDGCGETRPVARAAGSDG